MWHGGSGAALQQYELVIPEALQEFQVWRIHIIAI